MSPPGDCRSVPSPLSQTTSLTNQSQPAISLHRKLWPQRCPVQQTPAPVSETVSPSPKPRTSTLLTRPNIRISSFFKRPRSTSKEEPCPSQVLGKARSALLRDKSQLTHTHPLRKRTDKHDSSLKAFSPLPDPNHNHPFPPKPPKHALRGLSRARQRERVGDPERDVIRSTARDALLTRQINAVEFQLWEAREPKELAGLGMTFVRPSPKVSVDTVERWLTAQALLKMGIRPDEKTLSLFEKDKLILLYPDTGLPLDWEVKWSNDDRPYFVNAESGKKQWELPKGTDVRRFGRFFAEN